MVLIPDNHSSHRQPLVTSSSFGYGEADAEAAQLIATARRGETQRALREATAEGLSHGGLKVSGYGWIKLIDFSWFMASSWLVGILRVDEVELMVNG